MKYKVHLKTNLHGRALKQLCRYLIGGDRYSYSPLPYSWKDKWLYVEADQLHEVLSRCHGRV